MFPLLALIFAEGWPPFVSMMRWPPASSPHEFVVETNGSFTPSVIEGRVGDTMIWTSLGHKDSIVPYLNDVVVDPCDAANKVAVDFDESFVGPVRLGIPGLFVRLGSGGGPEIIAWPGTCPGGPLPTPYTTGIAGCCDTDPSPAIGDGQAYCDDQTGEPEYLIDEMWDYDELTGQLVIIDWRDLETADQTFDWTRLSHELDAAADHGKFVTIAIKTGLGAVPSTWLFTDLGAPGSADDVTPVTLKGANSDDDNDFSATSCGTSYQMGSYTDPEYVDQLNELITALGTHVKSDGAWVQATAAVLLVGVHIGTDEFQAQTICADDYNNSCAKGGPPGTCGGAGNGHAVGGADGVLDSYTGDDCVCNAAAWGQAVNGGWAVDSLVDFVQAQAEHWHTAFWPELVVRFGLKQSGLPAAPGTAGGVPNFVNDDLKDQTGALICPTCVTTDDNQLRNSSGQVDAIIERGLAVFGDTFWVMHHGLDPLPMEFDQQGGGGPAAANCSWGGTPDLLAAPPIVTFPIPLVGPVGNVGGCPNKWANNTTLTPPRPHMTGFQTNNPQSGGISTPAALESSMMQLERNTNAVYWEGYANIFWMNRDLNGNGDMNPLRETSPWTDIDPAMRYSKPASQHKLELIARRDSAEFEQASGKAFPPTYSFTFTEPGTYRFYNPRTCSDGVGKSGRIVIQ